ncbi:contact-dependent growth inhibition system immunity protein [Acidomonas methanolica]|uniref:contact-dependent growth inhibition system immunity protein n=2 Tax=Acidomonas methanolica TaxID=437 RepID=UPI001051414A|nr:contact-dependent growth inhibition system immunity protein [Acidomonas methanolica]MBU2654785.1 CdiI family contact-dependent growth inhibition immunity protein [Acidomonas methanolica]TCS18503.1 uncharacterized protein DUF1436 [Acidomonas methanolica]
MNNRHLTPERIRWLHRKSAGLCLSPKYISIQSREIWGGEYFSRTGWCAHAPWDASPQWIGENFRKAITTSEYFNVPGAPSVDVEAFNIMEPASNTRRLAFCAEIAATYGYKTIEDIGRRCDVVFTEWHYLVDDIVILKASKRMSGGHSGWPTEKLRREKSIHIPLSSTDEELGLAIREAFSRCEAPGRQKINWPREETG